MKAAIKKKIIFVALFIILAYIASLINFSPVVGSNAKYFTFFQFIGPITGFFLGPVWGIITVLAAEIPAFFTAGQFDIVAILRLLPMLFATYYVAVNREEIRKFPKIITAVIPLICMALFIMHPVGREAWVYSLYWLIPMFGAIFSKNLFMKSLGATFTAHAIGTTVWLYTIPMTKEMWISLIPVVAFERILFASGIALSFLVVNAALFKLESWQILPKNVLNIDLRYVFARKEPEEISIK